MVTYPETVPSAEASADDSAKLLESKSPSAEEESSAPESAASNKKTSESATSPSAASTKSSESTKKEDTKDNLNASGDVEMGDNNVDKNLNAQAIEAAGKAKAEGNDKFKTGDFKSAIKSYTAAIDLFVDCQDAAEEAKIEFAKEDRKNLAVCYSNRAFCHIKMENFGSAIVDGEAALEADPSYIKAYYRLGCAKFALQKFPAALKVFKKLVQLAPNDADAKLKLKETEKVVKQEKFAKAIQSENTQPISERAVEKLAKMDIEPEYDGPVYPGREGLTHEWCVKFCEYMKEQKSIHKKYAYELVLDAYEVLKQKATLVDVPIENEGDEFTTCGDVHGQFYDLMNIWEINGYPSEKNPYLFNGDFVDRGSFSSEVILALFAWMVKYPKHMHLSRGNHESKNMNKMYGFEGEIKQKFELDLYNLFCEVFCALPLCHVLNKEVFIVHGGLFSSDNVKLDDIRKIDRLREPPDEGLMTEMLWSDPQAANGRSPSKRGVGCMFGPDVAERFLKDNDLKMIVRSHEMKDNGYEIEHGGKTCTIFSAPNYCDTMGNKGAFIRWKLESDPSTGKLSICGGDFKSRITSFASVPHPKVRAMQYANPMLSMF